MSKFDKFLECIKPSVFNQAEISRTSRLLTDLELDSLSIAEIDERIEREFGCRQIKDFELMALGEDVTVGEMYTWLAKNYL